jgi:hypothetical protein
MNELFLNELGFLLNSQSVGSLNRFGQVNSYAFRGRLNGADNEKIYILPIISHANNVFILHSRARPLFGARYYAKRLHKSRLGA